MTTAITLTVFGLVMLMGTLSWAACLWLGARWAKIETATVSRALNAAVLATIIGALAYFDELIVPRGALANVLVYQLGRFAVGLLTPIAVVMAVFGTTFFRALRAWLCTLPAPFLLLPFFIFVFRPYVSEAFVATANSMAPTIRGEHIRGVCPRCGAEAVGTPLNKAHMTHPLMSTR